LERGAIAVRARKRHSGRAAERALGGHSREIAVKRNALSSKTAAKDAWPAACIDAAAAAPRRWAESLPASFFLQPA
jgi:hypothetical protein